MTLFQRVLCILMVILASGAAAQPEPGEIHVETIDVEVVSVVAHVTDRSGRPVQGLTRDDFEIRENGTVREISNFSEMRDDTATESSAEATNSSSQTKRKVIVLLDGESLHPFNRNEVFAQLRAFGNELIRPGDEAMVAVWNDGLRVEVPFTSDTTHLDAELVRLSSGNTGRASALMARKVLENRIRAELDLALDRTSTVTMKDALKNSLALGHTRAEEERNLVRSKSRAIAGLLSTLAGVEGQKAMIFVGESFSGRPGIEIFQFINETFAPFVAQGPGEGVTLPQPETQAPEETTLIDSIARAANANGVAMYMLDASGHSGHSATSAESANGFSSSVGFLESSSSHDAFQSIATRTGGLAIAESSDLGAAFESIGHDFDTYYSLGYIAPPDTSRGERALTVTLRNPEYVVRTRRTHYTKSAQDEMVDRTVAELYYADPSGDIEIEVHAGRPEKVKRGTYRVPITVVIPSDSVTLIPNGDYMSGTFSVFVGVGDGRGAVSSIERRRQAVNVPGVQLASLRDKPFTFDIELLMRKGENVLAVGVQDNISSLRGFSRSRLDVR